MAAPNPHPDAKLFVQLYRLLSVYSLVSPPKGSNVSGVGNVEALVNDKWHTLRLVGSNYLGIFSIPGCTFNQLPQQKIGMKQQTSTRGPL